MPLSSFTHEGIELRLLPAGLLADLYAPQLPWRIEVGDGWGVGERGVADGFMNSVKEVSWHLLCPNGVGEMGANER